MNIEKCVIDFCLNFREMFTDSKMYIFSVLFLLQCYCFGFEGSEVPPLIIITSPPVLLIFVFDQFKQTQFITKILQA